MPETLFTYNPTLMSLRTAKYVEAMIREGDKFDYDEWLKKVREEEAQAKRAEATGAPNALAEAEINRPMSTPDGQRARPNPASAWTPKTLRLPRVRRPHRQPKSQTPKARLRGWLQKVRRACEHFQSSRKRDAVYGYLEPVFAIVEHFKVRRRTTRLLRRAFEFANLPFNKNAGPFGAVIRCTCRGNAVDNKTISKWSRALRYASRRKEPDMRLKTFMKEAGGVNACASLYAKQLARNNRVAAI